jgi:hypothetical protein
VDGELLVPVVAVGSLVERGGDAVEVAGALPQQQADLLVQPLVDLGQPDLLAEGGEGGRVEAERDGEAGGGVELGAVVVPDLRVAAQGGHRGDNRVLRRGCQGLCLSLWFGLLWLVAEGVQRNVSRARAGAAARPGRR